MDYSVFASLPEILRDFLAYSDTIKGKSSLTIDEYYFDLQTFFRYIILSKGALSSEIEFDDIDISSVDIYLIKQITLSDLYGFLVFCKDERGNNSATRARKASTLRIFFRYLTLNKHLLDTNPAELLESPKIKQTLPKYLSVDDSLKLLNSVNGVNYERDYCILTLFLNCGMRLSELVGINLSDIHSDNSITITGKGNKQRIIYLNEACMRAIDAYLKVRPNEGVPANYKNALFISRNKRRISNKTVQHIVKTYLEKAGLEGYSTHKLRHTAATLMYQEGHVDVRVLKEILGHANLGTTQIYTHVANSQIENAFTANPLSKVKADNKKDE